MRVAFAFPTSRTCCRQNMKRALNLSAWTQALLFLVLFLLGRWLYVSSFAAVKVSCPRHISLRGRHDYQVAACVGDGCVGYDILVKDATPLPGSFSDSDSAFEDHHQHEHYHLNSTPGMILGADSRLLIHPHNAATVATMQLCLSSSRCLCISCAELMACKCRVSPSTSCSRCKSLCNGGPCNHWGCLRCSEEDTDTQKVWHHWQPTGRLLYVVLVSLPLEQSTMINQESKILLSACLALLL